MTALVNGLEADGLVQRTVGPDDAREVMVEATTRGRRILQHGRRRRVERLGQLLGDLDEEQLRTLDRAAEIIEAAMADELGRATGQQA